MIHDIVCQQSQVFFKNNICLFSSSWQHHGVLNEAQSLLNYDSEKGSCWSILDPTEIQVTPVTGFLATGTGACVVI